MSSDNENLIDDPDRINYSFENWQIDDVVAEAESEGINVILLPEDFHVVVSVSKNDEEEFDELLEYLETEVWEEIDDEPIILDQQEIWALQDEQERDDINRTYRKLLDELEERYMQEKQGLKDKYELERDTIEKKWISATNLLNR
jgi:hypothetical protein